MSRERRRERLGVEARPVRYVDADLARKHLEFLASKKVSIREISKRTGSSASYLLRIRQGKVASIRKDLSNRILGIPGSGLYPKQIVEASEAKKIVDELLRAGYSKAHISLMIGNKTRTLVIRDHIRADRLAKLRTVYRKAFGY
jgi:transcriptional regulator with XRE-family HTH domain